MALVSTKGVYGLTAVLILAKEGDKNLLQTKQIASKGDIPQNYLEQILVVLKRNGLVQSIRGASGGYKLAKDTKEITVYDVLNALESSFPNVEGKVTDGLLKPFWEDTQKKLEQIFSLNISELEEFLDKNSENIIYYI